MGQKFLDLKGHAGKKMDQVRYLIGVAAGKGGVGKSSVAVNLAFTFQKMGYQVGILDADIYGPSLGLMMPLDVPIEVVKDRIVPGVCKGVKVVSLGHLRSDSQAMIVRAPVANGLVLQCLEQVEWGELDYLFVDFPPGTGDIQLTLMQTVTFSGAILVTTPQQVSLIDVEKAFSMFHSMGVSVLGVVENMSYFFDSLGSMVFPFGQGAGESISRRYGAPFLGKIPVNEKISSCCDSGTSLPFVFPDHPVSVLFQEIAVKIRNIAYLLEEGEKACLKHFELIWEEYDCSDKENQTVESK